MCIFIYMYMYLHTYIELFSVQLFNWLESFILKKFAQK